MTASATDLIGRWFLARRRQGVDDTMYFAVVDASGAVLDWQGYPHASHDGLGALTLMLEQQGCTFRPPRHGRALAPPSLWSLLKGRPWRHQPAINAPQWLRPPAATGNRRCGAEAIQVFRFSQARTRALEQRARELQVSLTALVLAAQHRVISAALCQPGTGGGWFVPVDLRASISLPRFTMNHCSGVFLDLPAAASPAHVHRQVRERLRAGLHWWYWLQARLVARLGQWCVNVLYGRLARPGRYLGSFSMLGHWQVDWRGSGFPADAALACCGPGSPTYPVANGVMVTNGALTLALKADPSLGLSDSQVAALMHDWVGELMAQADAASAELAGQEQVA